MSESADAADLIDIWRRTCAALDGRLRAKYLLAEIENTPRPAAASALDRLCFDAEQGDAESVEVLVSLVDLVVDPSRADLVHDLRGEAARASLLALGRLVRFPRGMTSSANGAAEEGDADESNGPIPEYAKGRMLTLGERKALARKPTRQRLEKLLLDPHPVVIETLLDNPTVVERDVLRLAARRPGRADILSRIAHNPRWAHRTGIRVAIVLNPDAPLALSIPLLALLSRSELSQVVRSPSLSPLLRAEARERLARRPPFVQSSSKIQQ